MTNNVSKKRNELNKITIHKQQDEMLNIENIPKKVIGFKKYFDKRSTLDMNSGNDLNLIIYPVNKTIIQ